MFLRKSANLGLFYRKARGLLGAQPTSPFVEVACFLRMASRLTDGSRRDRTPAGPHRSGRMAAGAAARPRLPRTPHRGSPRASGRDGRCARLGIRAPRRRLRRSSRRRGFEVSPSPCVCGLGPVRRTRFHAYACRGRTCDRPHLAGLQYARMLGCWSFSEVAPR